MAETMMYAYKNQNNVEVRIARIFNTFGPRMHHNDGRVVSNFIIQALQNKDITLYGDGSQTRSFQFVDDLVDGLHALMNSNYSLPVNLGNPDEYTVGDFAATIKRLTKSNSRIVRLTSNQDDPKQRKPVITTAETHIGWRPKWSVARGLAETIAYFERELADAGGEIIPTGPRAASISDAVDLGLGRWPRPSRSGPLHRQSRRPEFVVPRGLLHSVDRELFPPTPPRVAPQAPGQDVRLGVVVRVVLREDLGHVGVAGGDRVVDRRCARRVSDGV